MQNLNLPNAKVTRTRRQENFVTDMRNVFCSRPVKKEVVVQRVGNVKISLVYDLIKYFAANAVSFFSPGLAFNLKPYLF